MKRIFLIPVLLTGLAACQTVPPTNIHQPMSVRPEPRYAQGPANGSIYQAAYSRPLFEDRKARYVGDILTVKITENTSASTTSNAKLDRTDKASASISNMSRLPGKSALGLGLDGSGTANFEGKGNAGNNNVFTGNMTVTVIEVLPNNNLLVSGEKQLAIGTQQEFVRVSGVVNPSFVDSTNTIESAKIADARIEYKSAGFIAEGEVMGGLARFFLNVLPF